ncbi:hypothetical protein CBR_g49662 [Chara braunii]|uniref:glutathione transferase n=1 Tax=Chara braunii TaxID=69332 RepID=A0A388M5I0_CHABU|nr:hypothetical protein CBR_g49662 [Chara braunii]|eukprot:GBG89811.1 hypothetical protein CBR_g49662 [Chara braunii]
MASVENPRIDAEESTEAAAFKVYGEYYSPPTQRVLMVLEELGLDYVMEPVDLMKGAHKTPEFGEKNPFHMVPVLEHGQDFVLFESGAIARYILTVAGERGKTLLGMTTKEAAKIDQWVNVEAYSYGLSCAGIFKEVFLNPKYYHKPTDSVRLEEHKRKFEQTLDVYEKILSKQEYLVGDRFTYADLTHIPVTFLAVGCAHAPMIMGRPHVAAWWKRISERESIKKVMAMSPFQSFETESDEPSQQESGADS